jgi:hypothetical protein
VNVGIGLSGKQSHKMTYSHGCGMSHNFLWCELLPAWSVILAFFFFFPFIVVLDGGTFVAFTKVLTMYQLYHT